MFTLNLQSIDLILMNIPQELGFLPRTVALRITLANTVPFVLHMYFCYIPLGRFEKRRGGGVLTIVEHQLCTGLIYSKEVFNDPNFMEEEIKAH